MVKIFMKNFILFVALLAPSLTYSETQQEPFTEVTSNDFITTHKLENKTYTLTLNTACDLTITASDLENSMTVSASSKEVTTKIRGNQIQVQNTKSSHCLKEAIAIEVPKNICINVNVNICRGTLQINDLCGKITVDASGHVKVMIYAPSCDVTVDGNACSGSIKITDPKRNVTVTSNSGCIVFKAQNLDLEKQRISFKTTSGDVTCFVPKGIIKKELTIVTTSGAINSDFSYTKPWPKWMIGSKNSAAFSIKTTSGDVTVSKI
jgi:hypothetical protein